MDRLFSGEKLNCPCCGRYAQIYKRRIHLSVALQLIQLYKLGGRNERRYVHASVLIPKGNTGTGDIGKAFYFNLIEPKPVDPYNNSSGYWRLTEIGCKFVEGTEQIKKTVFVFNDEVIGSDEETVTIRDCLNNKFDYLELMEFAA